MTTPEYAHALGAAILAKLVQKGVFTPEEAFEVADTAQAGALKREQERLDTRIRELMARTGCTYARAAEVLG